MFSLIACLLFCILPTKLPAEELIVWGVHNDRGLKAALRLFETEHPDWELVTSAVYGNGLGPMVGRRQGRLIADERFQPIHPSREHGEGLLHRFG